MQALVTRHSVSFYFIDFFYLAHLATPQDTGATSQGNLRRSSRFNPTQWIYPSLNELEHLFQSSSFITPTTNPALKVFPVVLQSVKVSLSFTTATLSIVVSTSAPQISSIPSSAALIVPSTSALVISNSSIVPSSSNIVEQGARFTFNAFGPLDFAAIQGQPHTLPTTNYVKTAPKFQGNNASMHRNT
jgi:hypothetical protein